MPTLYEQLGGFDRILALTKRWHELCLADPMAAHPFEQTLHPHHNERLAAYLAEAFGGPALYSAGYGDESSMQRIHAGNGEHADLDETCLRAFDQALTDLNFPPEPASRASSYFRKATEAQRQYSESPDQVPDFLPMNLAE